MTLYRIENIKHEGPYINSCELKLMEWLEMYDIVDIGGYNYNNYMRTHPSPFYDTEISDYLYHVEANNPNFIFGFNSLKQLKKFFSIKEEIDYFNHYGFFISVYDIKEVNHAYHISHHQMIANKNLITIKDRIPIKQVFGQIA